MKAPLITLLGIICCSVSIQAKNPSLFPLEDVRLLQSPFKHAQETNLAYVMAMEPDKLLAPFLREAGLTPKKESYGNWENSGLDGHIGGHYLTALSLAYASTGDTTYKQRLDYFVSELKRAQDANGKGYVGGVPQSDELWREIAEGEIRPEFFSLNGRWVPWYNMHKTFAGLRDAYLLGKNEDALGMIKKLGDWTIELTKNLSDQQIQKMLIAEHGGMNEVLADYYAITGNDKYLALAQRFSERRILDPLLIPEDKLTGLHANTQIPKVVGFARIAQLKDDSEWLDASDYFWNVVANERSVVIGGNSVSEHFHKKNDFSSMIESVEGPETCNTYNMLKLSTLLYEQKANSGYIDFYERALYNHILSSQHPETGGLVYFTPMRPRHYRMYSQVEYSMWCCVGSGIENHFKYGEFIYAHNGDDLYVNLFIPSRLNWKEKGVVILQENDLPDDEETIFTIEEGGDFILNIRVPRWLKNEMTLSLNGKSIEGKKGDNYISVKRKWKKGDVLKVSIPMATRLVGLPDGSPYYAVVHGPFVMAAPVKMPDEKLTFFADDSRMGHVAAGTLWPVSDAPMFIAENLNVLDKIKRVPGKELKFKAPDLIGNTSNKQLELIPFFRVHETRYMLYWRLGTEADLAELKRIKAEKERALQALEEQTIDKVTPGAQQSEVEHNYKGEGAEAGVYRGRHWRHARGWFSYELQNPNLEARKLRLTFNGADSGRTFDIIVNDVVIKTITSDGSAGMVLNSRPHPVPLPVEYLEFVC